MLTIVMVDDQILSIVVRHVGEGRFLNRCDSRIRCGAEGSLSKKTALRSYEVLKVLSQIFLLRGGDSNCFISEQLRLHFTKDLEIPCE